MRDGSARAHTSRRRAPRAPRWSYRPGFWEAARSRPRAQQASARFYVARERLRDQRRGLYGEGVTTGGGGLARIGPVPGSSGTLMFTGVGVGLGALSPGSFATLVVSLRYQLLFGPGTTLGGFEYHRFAGT